MEENNIEIVKNLYRFFKERNDSKVSELLSEDIHWNQMDGFPEGGKFVGITEVLGFVFTGLRSQWADWCSCAEVFFASGNSVFVKGYYSGVHKISQKTFKAAFIVEYILKDGKITEFNQCTDTFQIVQATVKD